MTADAVANFRSQKIAVAFRSQSGRKFATAIFGRKTPVANERFSTSGGAGYRIIIAD